MWSLGEAIRAQRQQQRLSQQALAALVGISQPHLSQLERDEWDPSAWLLRKLCLALDLNADVLLALPATGEARQAELVRMREGERPRLA